MNGSTFIQSEMIPFAALALVLYYTWRDFGAVPNVRRYQRMLGLIMCILAADVLSWCAISNPLSFAEPVLWLVNIAYFLLSETVAYTWFLYVFYQINDNVLSKRQRRLAALSAVPLVAVCLIILTSPWNHMIFTIDPVTHAYQRGGLHIIQTLLGFSYMLLTSVLALLKSREAVLTEQKKECRFLGGIIALPFLGGLLQTLNFYFVFLWPFTAAAAFLIFVDFQSHRISVDPLTSLNNRGSLEAYLQKKTRERERDWYLMMMDVDRFKHINDSFGHAEGDRALQAVAQALRDAFGASNAFIARYGGDEFIVVADAPDPQEAQARCEAALLRCAEKDGLPFALGLSFGYARFDRASPAPFGELIGEADKMMYERKRAAR